MARLLRAHCVNCGEYNDQPSDGYVITKPVLLGDYDEFEHGSYVFTCNKCGAVNEKETTPKIEELLRYGGVMTIDELEQWFVSELTGEL